MFRNLSTTGLGISGVESEVIELALSYHFRGIDPDFQELRLRAEERSVAYARRLVDSAKLQLGTFSLPIQWQDDTTYKKELDRLSELAPTAASLGCTRAVTMIAPGCDQRPYHENFEFHRKRLAEICQVLAPHNISLGLEFKAPAEARTGQAFEFIHSFDELRKLMTTIGAPNAGVVVDSWHWHAGGGSLDDFKPLSANQVVSVVLADAPDDIPREQLTDRDRLLPGETNVVDCAGIVRWLSGIGYQGPVTAKPDRSRFPKTGRMQIVRLLADALDTVWTAADLPLPSKPSLATAGAG
jgi:sugar phosphate isomerase/epimerase